MARSPTWDGLVGRAWGEKHIDSGVAAIANATVPIFVVLLALRWQPSEAVRGVRLGGILLGLVGVGILAGVHPAGGWWGAAGTLAVVVASLSYAVGGLWGQRLVTEANGFALATAAMLGATLVLIPFGLAQLPAHVPGWKETGSVLALAVLGTAIAQILLFRVLRSDGATRMSLVTYLLPVTALFYGVTLLGEPLTIEELVGMVLILGGVALGSGAVRLIQPGQQLSAALHAGGICRGEEFVRATVVRHGGMVAGRTDEDGGVPGTEVAEGDVLAVSLQEREHQDP